MTEMVKKQGRNGGKGEISEKREKQINPHITGPTTPNPVSYGSKKTVKNALR
jgi:hypothetical protein